MKTKLIRSFLVAALLAAPCVADTVTWRGVSTQANSDYNATNVNDSALWSPAQVPGAADHAVFAFDDTRALDARFWRPVIIPPAGVFAPGSITVNCGAWNGPLTVPLYMQESLSTASLSLNRGYSSGGQSERIFRIGTAGSDCVAGPVYFTTVDSPAWSGDFTITGYKGSPIAYTLENFGTVTVFRDAVNANTPSTGVSVSIASSGSNRTLNFVTDVGGAAFSLLIDTTAVIGSTPISPLYWGQRVNGIPVYGMEAAVALLTLSGETPITFSNTKGCWGNLYLAPASSLTFSNEDITFSNSERAQYLLGFGLTGGAGTSVTFPTVQGSITLEDPKTRSEGNLWLHSPVELRVRSDQAWLNPSGLGFIRVTLGDGAAALYAIDGQPLDNFGQVALWLTPGDRSQSYTLPGGCYQGMRYTGAITSGGSVNQLTLTGPVTLTGYLVRAGNNSVDGVATQDPDYSLYLSTENRMEISMNLNGQALATVHGIHIDSPYNGTTYEQRTRHLNASGSTLTVGGDIVVSSTRMYAGFVDGTLRENLRMGLTGDADTVVNLHGSFSTRMRALSNANGLTLSHVNLLGGTAGAPKTWEVTADPSNTSFGVGSGAIGALHLGTVEAAAYYQLTNEHVNDNDPANIAKVKDGEVLLAGRLELVNGVFDANGHGVKLNSGADRLSIAATAILDLHTGTPLAVGDRVEGFVGLGDQTETWATSMAFVKDRSNPSLGFKPVLHTDGNTYWEGAPAGCSLIVVR